MTRLEARETARQLGPQYSAYGMNVNDTDGCLDEIATEQNWYVEFDDSILPDRIFGYPMAKLVAKQYK
jgi:hypothetical protein